MHHSASLPLFLTAPVLRRVTPDQAVIWVVLSEPVDITCLCYPDFPALDTVIAPATSVSSIRLGDHAYLYLLDNRFASELPLVRPIGYDLQIRRSQGDEVRLSEAMPEICYEGKPCPHFVVKTQIDHILHGSCRKPHYESGDALLRVDQCIQDVIDQPDQWPALLMMSGDQIYADDVAGPMLQAIHQVIALLGLTSESLAGTDVTDCQALYDHECSYYRRERLLPETAATALLRDRFFGGARKPIFTSVNSQNHLVTLAEMVGMYLLVWSPQLWPYVRFQPEKIPAEFQTLFQQEQAIVEEFAAGLPQVQRIMAHLPTYMIFDDHDVTDDWNLTRGWEESAYEHPFSKRIVGNALIAYLLCQGWGNDPSRFTHEMMHHVQRAVDDVDQRDALIDELLSFEHWDYTLPTTPKLVVMDTRTRRWWSESSASKPSGLMEWEALSELQQELIDQESVILVSPAPIYGVKLIEVIQRIFTYFGHALTVDAENWMAHPGSANVILNIFRHRKTPQHFVILSGDVHYSFAYDVRIRHRRNSPHIWQITCSGIKNEFPQGLLVWFDRLNRWLYATRSPLNWFTRRRTMRIKARSPQWGAASRLVNLSSIGSVRLDEKGRPHQISILPAEGGEIVFKE